MIVKIQHYNFEEGEFDKWENCSSEQALTLFNNFDLIGEYKKRNPDDLYPSFIIEKNRFIIRAFTIDANLMDLLYFQPDKTTYFRKRGILSAIRSSIEKFVLNAEIPLKDDFIEINMVDRRDQLNKHKRRNFNYRFVSLTFNQLLSVLLYSLLLIGSFYVHEVIHFLIGILLISSPVLFVYFQYYFSNKGFLVYLTRGNDQFVVTKNNTKTTYNKNNIKTIDYFYTQGLSRNPFIATAYINIRFNSGESLILNTQTIDKEILEIKFREQTIKKHLVYIPYIRKN